MKVTTIAGPEQAVRTRKLSHVVASCVASLLQLWRETRLYGYSSEIYSCYHRILLRYKRGLGPHGLQTDPALHRCAAGNSEDCSETHARIQDIQRLCSARS